MKTLALLFACVMSVTLAIPWVPEPKTDLDWIDLHNGFVENTKGNNGSIRVLFYGDSITAGWNLAEGIEVFNQYYAPLGTANYGIYGDRTEHVLWRIQNEEVTNQLNTAVCVIKIGTNNIDDDENCFPKRIFCYSLI